DGEWHHIAATYDEEMLRIYVDGEPDGQQARNTTPDNNDAPLTIAAVFETGGSPLTGALDDVGLFNVALEEDDIKEIMERGLKEAVGVAAMSPSSRLISTWGNIRAGD
ncbi:LamG domain-containing protein, partial [Candidatus Poribacteria bacterium]